MQWVKRVGFLPPGRPFPCCCQVPQVGGVLPAVLRLSAVKLLPPPPENDNYWVMSISDTKVMIQTNFVHIALLVLYIFRGIRNK